MGSPKFLFVSTLFVLSCAPAEIETIYEHSDAAEECEVVVSSNEKTTSLTSRLQDTEQCSGVHTVFKVKFTFDDKNQKTDRKLLLGACNLGLQCLKWAEENPRIPAHIREVFGEEQEY
mgnify:CR=1 FL=1